MPPNSPAAGPMSRDVIGGAHHLRVVFDDKHGVADVAQVVQELDEPLAVARVQPDAWLVQNIKSADQR